MHCLSPLNIAAYDRGRTAAYDHGRTAAFLAILLFILSSALPSYADKSTWLTIDTKYVKLYFQSEDAARQFEQKITLDADNLIMEKGTILADNTDSNLLGRKIDALFNRVQNILDMRKKFAKVSVNVYENKKSLQEAYNKFNRGKCRIRAWYVFAENGVYVSAADINAGILGHELAHAIIDHFLEMKPPKATAEILARYVDRHIDD